MAGKRNPLEKLLEIMRLRFAPAVETQFCRHYARKNMRFARLALLSGIVMFASYGFLDMVLAERYQSILLSCRFGVILPVMVTAWFSMRGAWFEHHMQLMLGAVAVFVGASIAAMVAVAYDEVGSYFFGIIITNFYAQAFARMRFIPSSIAVAVNIAIFNLALRFVESHVSFQYLVSSNYFIVSAALLGAVTAFSFEKLERQDFQQARNLSETNRELERNSLTDSLTGLPNRRWLGEHLATTETRCREQGGRFAIALVDIDHFKNLNDSYGHEFGDVVLKRVALTMRRYLRSSDLVGRWGGEEFLVILPHANGLGARLAALKLNAAIRDLVVSQGGQRVQVTATFGVAEGGANDKADDVVRRADTALYEGKRAGRDAVVLYADMHEVPGRHNGDASGMKAKQSVAES